MRFGRVHDGLEQMSNRSSLAVEDVLDLFTTFAKMSEKRQARLSTSSRCAMRMP